MSRKLVPINEISFKDHKSAGANINYPESGFYLVAVEDAGTDLRFVDKSVPSNMCIAPKSVFLGTMGDQITTETELHFESQEVPAFVGHSENNFVLDFAKILLKK